MHITSMRVFVSCIFFWATAPIVKKPALIPFRFCRRHLPAELGFSRVQELKLVRHGHVFFPSQVSCGNDESQGGRRRLAPACDQPQILSVLIVSLFPTTKHAGPPANPWHRWYLLLHPFFLRIDEMKNLTQVRDVYCFAEPQHYIRTPYSIFLCTLTLPPTIMEVENESQDDPKVSFLYIKLICFSFHDYERRKTPEVWQITRKSTPEFQEIGKLKTYHFQLPY